MGIGRDRRAHAGILAERTCRSEGSLYDEVGDPGHSAHQSGWGEVRAWPLGDRRLGLFDWTVAIRLILVRRQGLAHGPGEMYGSTNEVVEIDDD